jgi:hypothetical protein
VATAQVFILSNRGGENEKKLFDVGSRLDAGHFWNRAC